MMDLRVELASREPEGALASLASVLMSFADGNDISYHGWNWDSWVGAAFYITTNGAGHPTADYGANVKAHLCRVSEKTVRP